MPVAAQSDVYRCTVTQYFHYHVDVGLDIFPPKDGGPLVQGDDRHKASPKTSEFNANLYARGAIGKEFRVNIKKGIARGFDGVANDEAKKHHVLKRGGGGSSFMVLAEYGPMPDFTFLQVTMYARGPKKPFIALRDGDVTTGYCLAD